MHSKHIRLALCLLLLLPACGQKGALYLEGQEPGALRAQAKKKKNSPTASTPDSKPRQEPSAEDEKEKLPVLEPSPPN